ncbi:TraE/TraK family type IV conjugative transfer system protein [Sutterella sp.]|uniref:TraE/TraK family type IV conjugative transfer system protein n=1 Tax=Sutterella sp. TaxID=1981025 RepID=UPI003FD7AA34
MSNETAAARLGLRAYILRILALSLCANVIMAGAMCIQPETVTVILPPTAASNGSPSGWRITSNTPDPEYLEQWSISMLSLIATISPASMKGQAERFLERVAPEVFAEMQKRLLKEMDSLRADQAGQAFYPTRIRSDLQTLKVLVEGERRTFIGSTTTSVGSVVYELAWRYTAGRLYLLALRELPPAEAATAF